MSARLSVQRLRIAVGVVLLGFILALALGSAGLLGGGRALGSSTTVTVIGGEVLVRHGASGQFVPAVDGEVLNAGDAIRTGDDARAVLTYFEGSNVTIEPNSDLSIDAAATRGADTIVEMTQNAGRTWHVVTKLITGGSKYEVRTPASTASVRGTAFTVDTTTQTTTITTTEGTVIDNVPDPVAPGRVIEVPVPAGQQYEQEKAAPPAPLRPAPEPERKVTVTLSDQNTVVVDTLGRANGVDKNGKVVVQTPGATVKVVNGTLVVTLPNIPDGDVQTVAHKPTSDVTVQTTVEEKGKDLVKSDVKLTLTSTTGSSGSSGAADARGNVGGSGNASGQTRATVQIGKGKDTKDNSKDDKKKDDASATPKPVEPDKAEKSETPKPTGSDARGGGGAGGAAGGTSPGGAQGPTGQLPSTPQDPGANATPRVTPARIETEKPKETDRPKETDKPKESEKPKDTPKSADTPKPDTSSGSGFVPNLPINIPGTPAGGGGGAPAPERPAPPKEPKEEKPSKPEPKEKTDKTDKSDKHDRVDQTPRH